MLARQIIISIVLLAALAANATPAAEPAKKIDFNRDIRPILSDKCFSCHGPDEKHREAGLRLDTRAGATEDRDGVFAIVPNSPEASELITRINSTDDSTVMPPVETGKRLSQRDKALLSQWIAEGAEYAGHWAFLPVQNASLPSVRDTAWARNPIDRFILQRLESEGMTPSQEADKATLIRRAYLDLMGVLPSPDEVAEFTSDNRPGAYEALIDRLLANPHYGERWGRHWLDQARYADSNGYTIDGERTMWPYRDWVIRAINDDLPFDQFTIEQLAGDLLPNPTKAQLVATGFHRNTLINQEGGTDPEQFRIEEVMDRVNTTGAVWLGLTVGCAQCHTHKYDPISHREYYQLFAFFNHTQDVNNVGPTVEVHERELFVDPADPSKLEALNQAMAAVSRLESTRARRQAEWEKTAQGDADLVAAINTPVKDRDAKQKKLVEAAFAAADNELKEANQRLSAARREIGFGPAAKSMVMRELPKPRSTYLFVRGDFLRPDVEAGEIAANVPAVLPPLQMPDSSKSPNRLDLARWLVSKDNPLTPRVTVNRIWMRFFGRGLVETENDFGSQGNLPTHPELLDWLASEFINQGWSMKNLHRLIVTSATYRQSSHVRADINDKDPLNLLLARQNRLRLDGEIVRDVALSASDLLTRRLGGPSVRPPQPDGVYSFTQSKKPWTVDQGANRFRRAMYTMFFRSAPYPTLTTFDAPDFQSVCTRRPRSNTPLQSLTMANDEAMFEAAQALAARIAAAELPTDATLEDRVRYAFMVCFAREPQPHELSAVANFHRLQKQRFEADVVAADAATPKDIPEHLTKYDGAAWTAVARALMNTDEFITRE